MKNLMKNLGKLIFYFSVVLGIIFMGETAFKLMNQPNTLYFLGGILILLLIGFFLVGVSYDYISNFINNKNKNQKNEH